MNIPKTIKQATGRLAALDKITTVTEWERAAIVFAFTREGGQGEYQQQKRSSALLTPPEFANLGITGLRSPNTVRMYRDAWKEAMKDGAPDIKPGDEFVMPATTWPPTGTGTGGTERSVRSIRKELIADPVGTVQKIIGADQAAVEALAEGVANVVEAKEATVAAVLKVPTPTATRAAGLPPVVTNWNAELWGHLTGILDALKALREDKFTLDSFNSQGLVLLEHVLPEVVAGGSTKEADRLFADIEDFLSKKEATS